MVHNQGEHSSCVHTLPERVGYTCTASRVARGGRERWISVDTHLPKWLHHRHEEIREANGFYDTIVFHDR